MRKVRGKNGEAIIYTDRVEVEALDQVKLMLDNQITEAAQVRMMPDIHMGKGATIGTTIKLPEDRQRWKICPNVIGVDIGCSVSAVKIAEKDIDLEKLDQTVIKTIPTGFSVHAKSLDGAFVEGLNLRMVIHHSDRVSKSLGTLGGGNHFLELGKDEEGNHWFMAHTGSRNLGKQVAEFYQDLAERNFKGLSGTERKRVIQELKDQGRQHEISARIEALSKGAGKDTPDNGLEYLMAEQLDDYLHDMAAAQRFAQENHHHILTQVVEAMGWHEIDRFVSTHNFIDLDHGIIRKGATSAQAGERLIIPLNMRDGSLICVGKGNPHWNFSAPHGAGRKMSRRQAKESIQMQAFAEAMEGIYSSSINESTLDEAPFAYKDIQDIVGNISDTVDILHLVKPIWNHKGSN